MNKAISNNYLLDRIGGAEKSKQVSKRVDGGERGDFKRVLDEARNGVKFSKHAEKRLEMRNVHLSEDRLEEVSKAMDMAGAKGIRDALILVDGNALVASVTNKTIVTCAGQGDLESKIITNIDGAIVL